MPQGFCVAVIGATGAVGQEMLGCLERRRFPVRELRVMASGRSAGRTLRFAGAEHALVEAGPAHFGGVDIALMAVEADQSRAFSPELARRGAVVIDNSSAWRMDPEVPLVIPEINPQEAQHRPKGIIANPNCSTIIMNVPMWPLHRAKGLKRVLVSTYQAASGAGRPAMEELEATTRAWAEGRPVEPKAFPYPLVFNLFSHNAPIGPDGYNQEEAKMTQETRKIFGVPGLAVAATCVRVPVLRAHCEAISAEFEEPLPPAEARRLLEAAPGVRVLDDPAANRSPQPVDASGVDDIFVGRLREDTSLPGGRGLMLFVAGDQLLKGAALNAVQIAELVAGGGPLVQSAE